MKRTGLLLFAAALLMFPLLASAQGILDGVILVEKGDTAIMPHPKLVTLKNLEKISVVPGAPNRYGEECVTERGGTLSVVGIDGDRLLVRYSITARNAGHCQSGSLFFVGMQEFSEMTAKFRQLQEDEEKEKALIKRFLEN